MGLLLEVPLELPYTGLVVELELLPPPLGRLKLAFELKSEGLRELFIEPLVGLPKLPVGLFVGLLGLPKLVVGLLEELSGLLLVALGVVV